MKIRRDKAFIGVVLITFFFSVSVFVNVKAEETSSNLLSTQIELMSGDGKPPVFDPTSPTETVTPINPNNQGSEGSHTIDYSSNFYFGTQEISLHKSTYYTQPDMVIDKNNEVKIVPNFIQVTDQSGSFSGWTLTVKQDSVLHLSSGDTESAGYSLNGSNISFENASLIGGDGITTGAPIGKSSLTLTPGLTQMVVSAEKEQGAGSWLYTFGTVSSYDQSSVDTKDVSNRKKSSTKSAIKLTVPTGSAIRADKYTTTLTWNLAYTPTN